MTIDEAKTILGKNIVTTPGVNLQNGEICYYADEAAAIVAKNQNVGTTYNSFGTSLYGRGVGIHTNQGVRNIVRGTVVDQYPGHLYLTSRRVILVSYKAGFDISLSKLTGLDFYKDGLMVTSAGKSYLVWAKNVKKIQKIIEASNLILTSDASSQPTKSTVSKSDVISLKEYKELLDQGVITQEEFDQKKQELLNGTSASTPMPVSPAAKRRTPIWLWIGFVVMVFLAIFSLRKPIQIKFFAMFALLAIGFVLHIDPLRLRDQKKMLPSALTWIICIIAAIAVAMLL